MLDKELLETLIENSKANNKHLIWALAIMIAVPIVIEIIKAFGNYFSKKKEFTNSKQLLIKQNSLRHQESLFLELDSLSLLNNTEIEVLSEKISVIRQNARSKRIYFTKKQYNLIIEILDYYVVVCGDYSNKDISTENKNIDKFIKEFNK